MALAIQIGYDDPLSHSCGDAQADVAPKGRTHHICCFAVILVAAVLLAPMRGATAAEEQCGLLCDEDWLGGASFEDVVEEVGRGASVNGRDVIEHTPLHHALRVGADLKLIAYLIEQGADVSAASRTKKTPLMIAAANHPNLDVITLLLEHGAEVGAADVYGHTPLHAAADSSSNPETAALLLEHGAVLGARSQTGHTALHRAARNNPQVDMLAFLIGQGADVNAPDSYGRSPLLLVAENNRAPEAAALLLKHGADIGAADGTDFGGGPLHWAAASGNLGAATVLLSNGADIDARDLRGQTPLHWAVRAASPPQQSCDEEECGVAAVFLPDYMAVVTVLLGSQADVNAKRGDGRTPLVIALADKAGPALLRALLEHGADPNVDDPSGCSPLSIANLSYDDPDEAKALLVGHGAEDGLFSFLRDMRCLIGISDWELVGR